MRHNSAVLPLFKRCFIREYKKLQNKNLKKNFIWNTIGSLTYFFAQWLFTILVWQLSTGQNQATVNAGLLATSITMTGMFLSLASYGMYNYQVSDTENKFTQSQYIKSRFITCAMASVLCIVFVAITGIGNPYSIAQIICILLMLCFRMIESKTDVYNAIMQRKDRLDLVGKTYAARAIISIAGYCVLLFLTNSMVYALSAVAVLNVLFFILYTKRISLNYYTKQKTQLKNVFLLLKVCAPLALYTFLCNAALSVPKIILQRMVGAQELGIYNSVTAPVLLLQVGATYLFTPFITIYANNYKQKNKSAFLKAFLLVLLAIVALIPVGVIGAQMLGAWGLRVFVSASLEQYAYLLVPMAIAAILTALVLFFSMVLTVMRCMPQLIVCNILSIVTSVVVSAPLILKFNMQGVNYACICALGIQTIGLAICTAIKIKKHFNNK